MWFGGHHRLDLLCLSCWLHLCHMSGTVVHCDTACVRHLRKTDLCSSGECSLSLSNWKWHSITSVSCFLSLQIKIYHAHYITFLCFAVVVLFVLMNVQTVQLLLIYLQKTIHQHQSVWHFSALLSRLLPNSAFLLSLPQSKAQYIIQKFHLPTVQLLLLLLLQFRSWHLSTTVYLRINAFFCMISFLFFLLAHVASTRLSTRLSLLGHHLLLWLPSLLLTSCHHHLNVHVQAAPLSRHEMTITASEDANCFYLCALYLNSTFPVCTLFVPVVCGTKAVQDAEDE